MFISDNLLFLQWVIHGMGRFNRYSADLTAVSAESVLTSSWERYGKVL